MSALRLRFVVSVVAGLVALGAVDVAHAHGDADAHAEKRRQDPRGGARVGMAFAPFDAGAGRAVPRQGRAGLVRRPHPAVGDAAHIPGSGPPPPPLRRDPDVPEQGAAPSNAVASSLSSNPLYLASLFYSQMLTRVDGPRCQHMPTCSRFAYQAVARHGALGIVIGLDRLIQGGMSSSVRFLPDVEFAGTVRHFDPLENYEFWHPERFTGFPPPAAEVPLRLPGEQAAAITTTTATRSVADVVAAVAVDANITAAARSAAAQDSP